MGATAVIGSLLAAASATATVPARPAGWPSTLPIGLVASNGPYDIDSAATQRAAKPGLTMRYIYLSGDARSSYDWASYDGGNFVPEFISDSQASGFIPVFTFYEVCQSGPAGCGPDEQSTVTGPGGSLHTNATMLAVFGRLKHFFQQAAGKGSVVLHVEPDTWGFIEATYGDDATKAPVQVAATGMTELAGLPNTAAGFAQAVVRLRDMYAPNVVLGYQLSDWGTGTSVGFNDDANLPDAQVQTLAARSVEFEKSLGVTWQLMFAEFYNQDAGHADPAHAVAKTGPYWWDASDYARQVRYLGLVSNAVNLPVVLWQIPLGNTVMRAMNNTPRHYQDNRVQTLLGETGLTTLHSYVEDANVIGLLFGAGIGEQTCACDATIDLNNDGDTSDAGETPDGVTNPAAINGNTAVSYNADDDGGYFGHVLAGYVASPITLPAVVTNGGGGGGAGGGNGDGGGGGGGGGQATAGTITLGSSTAKVAKHHASVLLTCSAVGPCSGSLALAHRRIACGRSSYSLTAGTRHAVSVTLGARCRPLLSASGHLRVTLTLTPMGGQSRHPHLTLVLAHRRPRHRGPR
jgi:hypothetical protein